MSAPLTESKQRLLEYLATHPSSTAPALAEAFALTEAAIRQHLESLEGSGLIDRHEAPSTHRRGRPPVAWSITETAHRLLPDRHGELTAELIDSIRSALGEQALNDVLAARASKQHDRYARALGGNVRKRVRELARIRTDEGYMATVDETDDGFVLTEHHCPVAGAAEACHGLCATELAVFREVLGSEVDVHRTEHLIAGDGRCSYRITAR